MSGRWLTPDPVGGDLTNPQSLNRYTYVLNQPTTLIDPSGLGVCKIRSDCWQGGRGCTWANGCRADIPDRGNFGSGCTLDSEPISCTALLQAVAAGLTNVNPTMLSTVGGTVTITIPGGCVTTEFGSACDAPQTVTISSPGCGGILGCFFSGFVNTFLNGNARTGVAQLVGSLAIGSAAFLTGGTGEEPPVGRPSEATAPVGRLGSPINIQPGTNVPATINGIDYSGHALDQMQGRGLVPSVVEDALSYGIQSAGRNGATVFATGQVVVVQAADGTIIAVYPR